MNQFNDIDLCEIYYFYSFLSIAKNYWYNTKHKVKPKAEHRNLLKGGRTPVARLWAVRASQVGRSRCKDTRLKKGAQYSLHKIDIAGWIRNWQSRSQRSKGFVWRWCVQFVFFSATACWKPASNRLRNNSDTPWTWLSQRWMVFGIGFVKVFFPSNISGGDENCEATFPHHTVRQASNSNQQICIKIASGCFRAKNYLRIHYDAAIFWCGTCRSIARLR